MVWFFKTVLLLILFLNALVFNPKLSLKSFCLDEHLILFFIYQFCKLQSLIDMGSFCPQTGKTKPHPASWSLFIYIRKHYCRALFCKKKKIKWSKIKPKPPHIEQQQKTTQQKHLKTQYKMSAQDKHIISLHVKGGKYTSAQN